MCGGVCNGTSLKGVSHPAVWVCLWVGMGVTAPTHRSTTWCVCLCGCGWVWALVLQTPVGGARLPVEQWRRTVHARHAPRAGAQGSPPGCHPTPAGCGGQRRRATGHRARCACPKVALSSAPHPCFPACAPCPALPYLLPGARQEDYERAEQDAAHRPQLPRNHQAWWAGAAACCGLERQFDCQRACSGRPSQAELVLE